MQKESSLNEKAPEGDVSVIAETSLGKKELPYIDPAAEKRLLRKVSCYETRQLADADSGSLPRWTFT